MAAAGHTDGYLVTDKLIKRFDEAVAVDEDGTVLARARVAHGAQGNGLDDAALAAEVAAARVQATEAYRYCAQEAIQLHGGVGFTWEYDPQLHFKRAQWASQWFGPTRDWREALAAHLLDAA